jgi:citrate lyase subunit beta/citryl-CoA lyase
MLFTPGNVPKKLGKLSECGADGVILDLEDTVPPAEKGLARSYVAGALSGVRGPRRYARVNAWPTGFTEEDLEAVVGADLDGIVLPKVESRADLERAHRTLSGLEAREALPRGSVEVLPIVETALGLWRLEEIAFDAPRVKRLSFGAGDFMRDIGTTFGPSLWSAAGTELLYARSRLVVASRAAGLEPPIDTVYLEIRNLDGLEAESRHARQLGFQGKMAIHPDQVPVLNRAFAPLPEEIAHARKVVEAFERAEKTGTASLAVDGAFVDYPIVAKARWLLEVAKKAGLA